MICMVNYAEHNAQDLVVDQIKVWAIRRFAPSFTSV